MKKAFIFALAAVAPAAFAQTVTIATFSDPSMGSGNPLVTFDTFNNTLDAAWTGTGLTLETPGFIGGGQYTDVTFTMSQQNLVPLGGGVFLLSGGSVNFLDNASQPLFTVTFDSGLFVDPVGFGASDVRFDNVVFSGPNVPSGVSNETANFSFANRMDNQGIVTYTSSFTSSAAVPEPASMIALGAGLAALAARRRRNA